MLEELNVVFLHAQPQDFSACASTSCTAEGPQSLTPGGLDSVPARTGPGSTLSAGIEVILFVRVAKRMVGAASSGAELGVS